MIFNLECIICNRNYKDMIHIKFDYKIILRCIFNFFQCTDVREVNLVYPIHNGSCHKQQMINNNKLNHGKPQLQLWIDSLNEMFLSRWTAHEQWNITFILLKTRREEWHQFVNLLPDRHAQFVIIQWITCVVPKLANLLMHSQCALSEPISSSRKTRKWRVCRFI
jgi:hypothetical protein